jgi:hypothetical protein
MFWWMNQEAFKTFTKEERRAAYGAWAIVIVVLIAVMVPLDSFLTFSAGTGHALAGGLSAGAGTVVGLAISALLSPRIWPILAKPRREAQNKS